MSLQNLHYEIKVFRKHWYPLQAVIVSTKRRHWFKFFTPTNLAEHLVLQDRYRHYLEGSISLWRWYNCVNRGPNKMELGAFSSRNPKDVLLQKYIRIFCQVQMNGMTYDESFSSAQKQWTYAEGPAKAELYMQVFQS